MNANPDLEIVEPLDPGYELHLHSGTVFFTKNVLAIQKIIVPFFLTACSKKTGPE
jgi:hypothetical protein